MRRRRLSHLSSHVVSAMTRYSASAEDLETVGCFFVFQETRVSPRKTTYALRDHREEGQEDQSALQYAVISMLQSARNIIP